MLIFLKYLAALCLVQNYFRLWHGFALVAKEKFHTMWI